MPVPAWNSSPATSASGASRTASTAAARSSAWTKSRVCRPSPLISIGSAGEGGPQPGGDDAPLVERVRAVGVREAQRAGGQAERRGVGLAVGLDRQLRRAVGRDGVGEVGLVARWRVVAGRGVRRGEHEPADPRQPGRLEQADRPGDVGLERAERVAHRVVDPGPRRQVDDGVGAVDRRADRVRIGQRAAHQLVRDAVQVGGLADRQVVEDPDAIAAADQPSGEVGADEPGPAGDEDRSRHADRPVGRVRRDSARAFGEPSGRSGRAWPGRCGPRGP